MFLKMIPFLIFLLISMLLMIVNFLVSMKANENRNKLTSFECGFDSFMKARMPFSLHFFLVAIIFLVFDLEIIFLLPLPLWVSYSYPSLILTIFLFFFVLFLGIMHEYNEGSLNWK